MEEYFDNDNSTDYQSSGFPPKPVLEDESKNQLRKSLTSLLLYAVLFYFIFSQDLAYIAALLLIIILHELGHFLMMKAFNYQNLKIFFIPLLGAYTSGKKQVVTQLQLLLILIAGPLPGLIIGGGLYFWNKDLNNETVKMLSTTFIAINYFNLLPFYPLDGARIVDTLFSKDNFIIRTVFGIISIICLLGIGILTQSFMLLVIPILIGLEIYNESKNEKVRNYLKTENIDYKVDYNELNDKDYWLIRDCILYQFRKKYAIAEPGIYQYSLIEPVLINHIRSILQTKVIYNINGIYKLLSLLIYISLIVVPIIIAIMEYKA